MKKKVCVVTSTRADYGILVPLLRRIAQDEALELRLVVTGTHLCSSFGHTVDEIEQDGFAIAKRIDILKEEDSARGVSETMAEMLIGFSAFLSEDRPDLAVLLGDRYEIFAAAAALVNARIPIAHLHGGETTEGAIDECFRHGITKMAYLHFVSCEAYRKRVIQLGEDPKRVYDVGALGIENILNTKSLSIEELEEALAFPLKECPYALVTFHPVTMEEDTAAEQMEELLSALSACKDLRFLITKANADTGGRRINARLDAYAQENPRSKVVSSLGMQKYLSALRYACCAIGNSSSGIIEVPAFGIPSVNIGDRQRGRLQAESVINCSPTKEDILRAIQLATSPAFAARARYAVSLYGDGRTSERIYKILRNYLFLGQIDLKKTFYDVDYEEQI
jgi:GDP/UDP-N,N'-diacetylbacillosamine 2-epimerase (hydrolysing)